MGETKTKKAQKIFSPLDIIFTGGAWNLAYTQEAADFAMKQRIGIYTISSFSRALWSRDYWNSVPNNWNVPCAKVEWFEDYLDGHENISSFQKSDGILFEAERKKQNDKLRILCLDQYVMGETDIKKAQDEFGDLDIIYTGGPWNNSVTKEAYSYASKHRVSIYNSKKITQALWK